MVGSPSIHEQFVLPVSAAQVKIKNDGNKQLQQFERYPNRGLVAVWKKRGRKGDQDVRKGMRKSWHPDGARARVEPGHGNHCEYVVDRRLHKRTEKPIRNVIKRGVPESPQQADK